MFIFSGCGDDTTSVSPATTFYGDGKINLKITTDSDSSIVYGHAPQFFVQDEIPLVYLKTVGLFVNKIKLIDSDGESVTLYESTDLTEPTFYLREDYMFEDRTFLSDVVVKAKTYVKAEIYLDRVWVKYKTSATSDEVSWDAMNFNKTIVANALEPITIRPGENVNINLKFFISGRVGQTQGEFYPYVFIDRE
jgi:hypothetical protein